MIWVWVAAIVAAALLVGAGALAFWPAPPPIDDTPLPSWWRDESRDDEPAAPKHSADPKRRGLRRMRAATLDENLEEPAAGAESWMWNTEGGQTDRRRMPAPPEVPTLRPEAYHRWDNLEEHTRRLHPRDIPAPPPDPQERTQVIRPPGGPPPEWPPIPPIE